MDYFKQQLFCIAAGFGFTQNEAQAVSNSFDSQWIIHILERYGYSMLGILIVMAENDLDIDFSREVTLSDGNCYMHSLQNQTIENMSIRPHLTSGQIKELNMDIKQLRKLWCQTGKGYFAGKWGSKQNWKGNMSDDEWEHDWKKQSENGVYDGTFMASDMFVMVAAHRLQRHILIIDSVQKCIRFLDGNILVDNNVSDLNPFILAHTHDHYQSMIPCPGSESYWRQVVLDQSNINRLSVVNLCNNTTTSSAVVNGKTTDNSTSCKSTNTDFSSTKATNLVTTTKTSTIFENLDSTDDSLKTGNGTEKRQTSRNARNSFNYTKAPSTSHSNEPLPKSQSPIKINPADLATSTETSKTFENLDISNRTNNLLKTGNGTDKCKISRNVNNNPINTRAPSNSHSKEPLPKSQTPIKINLADAIQKSSFDCQKCSKKFKYVSKLTRHLKTHEKDELAKKGEEAFVCELCKIEFTLKHNLTRHKISSHSLKTFECNYCDKKFNRKDKVTEHEKIHEDKNFYEVKNRTKD